MVEIRFHPEAQAEYQAALVWEEHRFATLRKFPFSLVYQAPPDRIDVVAVAHSRRAPGYWKGRV